MLRTDIDELSVHSLIRSTILIIPMFPVVDASTYVVGFATYIFFRFLLSLGKFVAFVFAKKKEVLNR